MENERITFFLPHLSGSEIRYVEEALRENVIAPFGKNLDVFETQLQQVLVCGTREKCVVTLSSGTAALHLALVQLGVSPGDEVICQSFTFAASANPIAYLGAVPVFVDSEKDTWNMSPEYLELAIEERIRVTGRKPKAIIPVHLYGMPAKMEEIMAIANRYMIPVVEDAAEALGSTFRDAAGHVSACGTMGEFGVLSFNGNKIITTSGGGALVCSTPEQKQKTMFLATQARDNAPHYQHSEIGYNYRMSNVCAGIGRGQMEVLSQRIERRRAINRLYRELLCDSQGICFQTEPNADFYSNYWLTSILVDPVLTGGVTREDLRLACEKANIETRPLWKPMHLQPIFANAPFYGDGTSELLFDKGLCLPSGSSLSDEDIRRVATVIKNR